MLDRWKQAFADGKFRLWLFVSLALLIAALVSISHFLDWVEDRPGVVLEDPVLAMLTPTDFTWPIFIGIYVGLLLTIYWAAAHPWRWVMGVQAYTLFLALRGLSMWVAPFDPPPDMIPLEDPIVSSAAGGRTLTRDLFFSGHTATGTILTIVAPKAWQRWVLGLLTAFIATGVMWQHVHYSVDVIVAPFVAYACCRAAMRITPEARLDRL